jgi:hypothetical protein
MFGVCCLVLIPKCIKLCNISTPTTNKITTNLKQQTIKSQTTNNYTPNRITTNPKQQTVLP